MRERKRADRFEEAFVLVLISLNDRDVPSRWRRVVKAVSQTTLDTDLIGWFEQGSVLGLIRSVTDPDPEETATVLAETIRDEVHALPDPRERGLLLDSPGDLLPTQQRDFSCFSRWRN